MSDMEVDLEDFDEEVVETEGEVASRVLDDIEFEEVDEAAEEEEEQASIESLKAEIAMLKSQVGSAQSNDDVKEGFAQLGTVLKDLAKQKTGDPQTDQQNKKTLKDYEEFKKELANGYYESPVDAMEKYYQRKIEEEIAPAFQQVLGEVQAIKASVGKQEVQTDDVGKIVLDKYGDEVDVLVKSKHVSVQDAVQQVAGKHVTELIRAATEEALQGEQGKMGKNQNPQSRPAPKASSSGKIRVTPSDRREIEQEAQNRALDVGQYVKWLVRQGDARVTGKKRR